MHLVFPIFAEKITFLKEYNFTITKSKWLVAFFGWNATFIYKTHSVQIHAVSIKQNWRTLQRITFKKKNSTKSELYNVTIFGDFIAISSMWIFKWNTLKLILWRMCSYLENFPTCSFSFHLLYIADLYIAVIESIFG